MHVSAFSNIHVNSKQLINAGAVFLIKLQNLKEETAILVKKIEAVEASKRYNTINTDLA